MTIKSSLQRDGDPSLWSLIKNLNKFEQTCHLGLQKLQSPVVPKLWPPRLPRSGRAPRGARHGAGSAGITRSSSGPSSAADSSALCQYVAQNLQFGNLIAGLFLQILFHFSLSFQFNNYYLLLLQPPHTGMCEALPHCIKMLFR